MKHVTKKTISIVAIACVLGALTGGIAASALPISYDVSLSFTVNQINKQDTTQYQYDGYYAIQASDLFSDTIVSWFQTPSFLVEVYAQAGVSPDVKSLQDITGRFHMKKYSSQNLVLKFATEDEASGNKLSEAIVSLVEQRAKDLNQNAKQQALFEAVGSKPVIVKRDLSLLMGALYGVIAGMIISLFAVSLVAAMRTSHQNES